MPTTCGHNERSIKMSCADSNCGYYWKDENDDFPRCHFDGFGKAPCEEDDWGE
jgi:hypothetical protein